MILETSDRPLNLVRHVLQTIGYDDGAIVANYDFAVPEGRNALGQVDLAAFSDLYDTTSILPVSRRNAFLTRLKSKPIWKRYPT